MGTESATGGSARSQVDAVDDRRWRPRRGLAFAVQATSVLVPIACSIVAVEIATRVVEPPESLPGFIAWLLSLFAVAMVTMRLVQRQAKRLLPLATMLRLSLVFPDQAPSRFALALRNGNGRALQRSVERAAAEAEFGTPQQAAEAVVALMGAIGRHDRLTLGHCERVRAYSDLLGRQLGLDADSLTKLHWASLLHDVGKLKVSPAILNKPGRLTDEEWQEIRAHPGHSDALLQGLRPWLGDWALAASEHHERFDGAGYPRGVAGTDISLAGRIVAVADAFDVMTAARSYKKPFPPAKARVELTDCAGTQFDPRIVRAFLEISLGELRRVMGPLAWFGAVPELVHVTLTTAFEPVRTATVAVGAAAAVAVAPVVAMPVPTSAATPAPSAPAVAVAATTTLPVPPSSSPAPPATRAPDRPAEAVSPTTHAPPTTRPPDAPVASPPSTHAATPTTRAPDAPVRSPTPTTMSPPTTKPAAPKPPTPTTASPPTTASASAPIARNDNRQQLLSTALVIDALVNDTDADGNIDPSTLRIVQKSANDFTVAVVSEKVEFGATSLLGQRWFDYEICDTTARCATARVTVNIVLSLI